MAEPNDIDSVRARIHRQRERLARDEPAEAVTAEAVANGGARPFAARGSGTSSFLSSVGRAIADNPGLALGIGAVVLAAGPRRVLRIARKGVRGAIVAAAAYRSVSKVASLVSSARSTDPSTIDEPGPDRGQAARNRVPPRSPAGTTTNWS